MFLLLINGQKENLSLSLKNTRLSVETDFLMKNYPKVLFENRRNFQTL